MQNLVFHNPTKIIFGRDTVPNIGPETAELGHKCLLVCGQSSIRETGLYNQVRAYLTGAGVAIIEHDGVQSNPLLGHVRAGIAKVKEHGLDVIVAVGGGSVLDSA
jgi:alcohol dehydrogenase YqhD (iron-dependent ADH family)